MDAYCKIFLLRYPLITLAHTHLAESHIQPRAVAIVWSAVSLSQSPKVSSETPVTVALAAHESLHLCISSYRLLVLKTEAARRLGCIGQGGASKHGCRSALALSKLIWSKSLSWEIQTDCSCETLERNF